ncbi:MAG TPA: FecR family protein [Chthoniobacteraceae bacterium]|jgi:hypothetical protein|nr:FecR family protein [Chthoniobacteraceae bacterium]
MLLALAGAASLGMLCAASAATPFSSATVTQVENHVAYGNRTGDRSVTRDAHLSDVVRANNFLRSESNSRAELTYPDGTVVRIGQNTVFTFDAESRTLSLEKGSLLFHIPKGAGGGTIKTASLTAAITGTAGKVSDNIIAIIEGTVKLIPSGRLVHQFEFARRNADGSITISPFDPARANDGALANFNGKMPGFPDVPVLVDTTPGVPFNAADIRALDVFSRTNNLPGAVNRFEPLPPIDRNKRDKGVPPPSNSSNGNDNRTTNY